MTLAELKAQKQTPMMMDAINHAIATHGANAQATITAGWLSYRRGSNAYKAAKSIGAASYAVYAGPRAGRRRTEGYRMVVVAIA